MSCAALAIACVGMLGLRLSGAQTQAAEPVAIRSIAAGDHTLDNSMRVADIGSRARVKSVSPSENSLFAVADGDIPLVAVNGCVYRMLTAPKNVDSSLVGDAVGSVAAFSDTPSLAEDDAFSSGLSNVSGEGTAIHAVSGLDASTAVAAEVGGKMRLFQRVSYAGQGARRTGLGGHVLRPRAGDRIDALRRRHADGRCSERRHRRAARPRISQIHGHIFAQADPDRDAQQRVKAPARRFRRHGQRMRKLELSGIL